MLLDAPMFRLSDIGDDGRRRNPTFSFPQSSRVRTLAGAVHGGFVWGPLVKNLIKIVEENSTLLYYF